MYNILALMQENLSSGYLTMSYPNHIMSGWTLNSFFASGDMSSVDKVDTDEDYRP